MTMAIITLRKVPDDIHRAVKRIQLDQEDAGNKVTLEDLYVELVKDGIKSRQAQEKKS